MSRSPPLHLGADGRGVRPDRLVRAGVCVHAKPRDGDASGHGLH